MTHPFRDVVIAGVHNTTQARRLDGHTSATIAIEGALGALADAGIAVHDVDAVLGQFAQEMALQLRLGPCTRVPTSMGIPAVLDAASLIAQGRAEVALIAAGGAGLYTERAATAPWTRPENELVVGYGMFTAAEFALMARRHMVEHGTTPEQLATVAARIRNHGHVNPDAVYAGRGPFGVEDILGSRMVADPFHLLDCSTTSEGGCGLVLTTAERAADVDATPVWILGGASDSFGPAYQVAPAWGLTGHRGDLPAGYVGRRAAGIAFAAAGLGPGDIDTCELYDPFSFEIIRQLEAFGFCAEGEGGAFVESTDLPFTTDGGTMSFGHAGINAQQLQRVIRGVEQVRGTCRSSQVPDCSVALCSNGGSGALFNDVLLVGSERP